jgi:2-iminobutanoate/2-iminopropanoate deaminase
MMRNPGNPSRESDKNGTYISPAIVRGNFVFTSGHVGWDPRTHKAPPAIEAQTEQTIENLRAVLEASGSSLTDVVKVNVYLVNIEDFEAMNQVYRRYFCENAPARTTVGVAGLARSDLLIEIDMVALLPEVGES